MASIPTPPATPPAAPRGPVVFPAMGTTFEVFTLEDPDRAAPIVRAEAAAIEARFTRFSPASELSRLNAAAGEWTLVSDDLYEVLLLARDAQAWTGGVFNPLVLPAMIAAGYAGGDASGAYDRDAHIHADLRTRSVLVPRGQGLDLGGIVKGWAADRLLRHVGRNGFVNAGGDVRAVGQGEDGDGWIIGIEDARRPGYDAFVIALRDEAAATSGRNRRRWIHAGRESHHLIDPRTGAPAATDILAATVVAPSCHQAEVAAKTAAILGSTAGLAFLDRHGLDGLLACGDGSWLATDGMRRRFL